MALIFDARYVRLAALPPTAFSLHQLHFINTGASCHATTATSSLLINTMPLPLFIYLRAIIIPSFHFIGFAETDITHFYLLLATARAPLKFTIIPNEPRAAKPASS